MNTEIVNEIRNALKTQTNDRIPNAMPVIEVNPKIVKNALVANYELTNTTSATIITTPLNQDYYITSISLALIKDVTSTSTSTDVRVSIGGKVIKLLTIPSITLTAQTLTHNIVFPHPLKIDRGVNVTLNNSTNVANISATVNISYFIDECSNA